MYSRVSRVQENQRNMAVHHMPETEAGSVVLVIVPQHNLVAWPFRPDDVYWGCSEPGCDYWFETSTIVQGAVIEEGPYSNVPHSATQAEGQVPPKETSTNRTEERQSERQEGNSRVSLSLLPRLAPNQQAGK